MIKLQDIDMMIMVKELDMMGYRNMIMLQDILTYDNVTGYTDIR